MASISPLTRAIRAFTALVTVWCLACAAFEPLLAGLAGESGRLGMSCASERGREVPATIGAGGDDATSVGAPSTDDSAQDWACQCQGCHAPSPNGIEVLLDRMAMPELPGASPEILLSVVREPLVPPPQRSL